MKFELIVENSKKTHELLKSKFDAICSFIGNEKIVETNSIVLKLLDSIKRYTIEDEILKYYFIILEKALHKDFYLEVHPTFIEILDNVTIDELDMLKKIKDNNYEFIQTSELKNNRFYNQKFKRFDFPKKELRAPEKFKLYIDNLMDRQKLIYWPVYNQQAIREEGVQTGLTEYSRLIITNFGTTFLKVFQKNEN